ncbi:MAG: MFS transporter [Planctomycetes bacterium]|nr:MFS transporter [Planctomycetota bacterium]
MPEPDATSDATHAIPAPGDKPALAAKPALSRNVKVLGWCSLLNDISSEMTFPLLPQFVTHVLHGTAVDLGWIQGLADSVASLLKLTSGGLSDRIGARKPLVILGYGLTALVRPLAGLATLPWHLTATYVTDRLGKGIRTTPRDALIAETTAPSQLGRAFGFQRAMDHLGASIGPLISTAVLALMHSNPVAVRWLFFGTIIPGIGVVLLLRFGLQDVPPHELHDKKFSLSLKPFDGNFRLFLLAMLIFTLGNSSDMFLLKRAEDLGMPGWQIPLLWLALHLVKSSGSIAAGAVVNRLGARPMIVAGWAIYACVYLTMAFLTSAWQVWPVFLVYGIYYAVTEPIEKKFVADLAGRERKSIAYGWYNFAMGLGALPASVLFGYLYESLGALTAFGFGAGMAAVAAGLLTLVRAPRPEVSHA